MDWLVSRSRKNIAFLDEKWFYTTSRRKKLKILPQASFQSLEDVFVNIPKIRSQCIPCKVMFMDIVCPHVLEYNVSGRVLLKHVSKRSELKKASYNHNFVSNFELNHNLKEGKWKPYFKTTYSCQSEFFCCCSRNLSNWWLYIRQSHPCLPHPLQSCKNWPN